MTVASVEAPRAGSWREHLLDYGWVHVLIAGVAMAATYPGRTIGIGMITEPMVTDLELQNERVLFASMNLWATLLGALFCIPVGRWLDRYGCRTVLTLNFLALGLSVLWMSQITQKWELFTCLLLTRGLGQSSLSVVAMTLVSKWFPGKRLPMASAWFAVIAGPTYFLYIKGMAYALQTFRLPVTDLDWGGTFAGAGWSLASLPDWRGTWAGVGWVLVSALAPLAFVFIKGGVAPGDRVDRAEPTEMEGATLGQALRTPAFWVFALTTSYYGMVISGIGLWNQAIFKELNLDARLYYAALEATALVGIASKLVAGWLATKWPITRLLALCMGLLGVSLVGLPFVSEPWQVYAYAVVAGMSGGVVALVFFAAWGQFYGRKELGRIQGVAQMLTVLAAAGGPLLFELFHREVGSYASIFWWIGPISLVLAIAGWVVPTPRFVESSLKGTAP